MTGVLRQLAALLLTAVLVAPAAQAHRSGESQLDLRVDAAQVMGQWRIGLHDLASMDSTAAQPADLPAARAWLVARPELPTRLGARLQLKGDGQACPLDRPPEASLAEREGTLVLVLDLQASCSAPPRQLTVGYHLLFDTDPRHQGLLRLQASALLRPAVFTADSPEQVFTLRAASAWERLLNDLKSGLWHIWSGYDHLLFLLCLLLPAVQAGGAPAARALRAGSRTDQGHSLRPVLIDVTQVVTAFTLAHSVTLGLAAMHWVSLPARVTESAIAASVVVAAALNLRPSAPLRRWQAAFGFGLVHGFGFASAVDALGVPGASVLPTLLGFNLGVELGQLAVVAAWLPVGLALRGRPWYGPVVVRGGSWVIGALALLWLGERAFGLQFMPVH